MGGRGDADGKAVEQHHRAGHPFLQVLGGFIDLLGGNLVLLERGVVHEHIRVLLLVEVLHLGFLAVSRFQGIAPFVDPVERGAADEVLEADFVEGVSLARLAEIHLHHEPGLVVDGYFQSLAEITGLVRRHGSSLLRWLNGVGYSQVERRLPTLIVRGSPVLDRQVRDLLVEK